MKNSAGKRTLRHGVLSCVLLFLPHAAGAQNTWIAAWTTSPTVLDPDPDEPLLKIEDQTVRERVRISLGASQIRLRLSNECGASPLPVGPVTVALPNDAGSVKPESVRPVTFGGRSSVTIPAGAPLLSDPVNFPVIAGNEIAISIYFPKRVLTPTTHALALKRAVVSQRGDHTRDERLEGAMSESSILVTAVLVAAQPSKRVVVAFGDSVTDGDGSTVDSDHNWPSDFMRRLAKSDPNLAVVNEGIVGNRLLRDGPLAIFGVSALARFERDALSIPGVTHIVLLEGINDIGFPGTRNGRSYLAEPDDVRTPEEIIGAYQQLIARAHARGVKIIGATMTPFEGTKFPGFYSEAKDAMRQTVNQWIRTSGAFDGLIDFDAVLRDPGHPARLLPQFAAKDHLHPNDAGYQAVADAIDLALFR